MPHWIFQNYQQCCSKICHRALSRISESCRCSSFRMFPSSYRSSRSKPFVATEFIPSFDDQDLSTVQFWILIGSDHREHWSTVSISLSFARCSGVFISFLIVICMVSSILLYDKLFVKNTDHFHQEQTRRLKDFQVRYPHWSNGPFTVRCSFFCSFKELAGLPMEFHDLRSILMNEFILEAWKREKNRRERLS